MSVPGDNANSVMTPPTTNAATLAGNNPNETIFSVRTTGVWLTCEGIETDSSAQRTAVKLRPHPENGGGFSKG
jgi:hypothetical protein